MPDWDNNSWDDGSPNHRVTQNTHYADREQVGHEDNTSTLDPIFRWDPASVDTIEDEARELIAIGKKLAPFIAGLVESQTQTTRQELFNWIITDIIDSKNPRLRAVALGLAAGCSATATRTDAQWARHFNISKQAIYDAKASLRRKYGLNHVRQLRSTQARANMRRSWRERAESKKKKKKAKRRTKR